MTLIAGQFTFDERTGRYGTARACEGPGCSEVFVPKRSDQRFCGAACKQAAHRRRQGITPNWHTVRIRPE